MYAKFIPIYAVESFVLFPFTGDYLNLEMFKIFYLLGVEATHRFRTSITQALVSGNFFLPRYYIYYKVRNRSFVKNLGHRDFRVFSTRRTPAWRNGLHHLKLR